MKLLTHTINNNLFILLDNTIIKKNKNKYKIYQNNLLINIFNETKFLKFISKKYKQYYNKIQRLINNKYKGGSSTEGLSDIGSSAIEGLSDIGSSLTDVTASINPFSSSSGTETVIDENTGKEIEKSKNAGEKLNELLEDEQSDYMLVLRTIMILSKIIPKEFDLNNYITKIYEDIQNNNSSLVFTKQYLLNKLNKNIFNDVLDICKDPDKIPLEKYIPKNDDEKFINIQTFVDNFILLNRIKNNIDVADIENENDIYYQYKFNIKEKSYLWDGNIDEYLDKIFNSKKVEGYLLSFNNMISKHLDLDFTNAKDKLTYYDWKETNLSEDYLKTLNQSKSDNTYNINVKYNTLTKEFEISIKIAKTKFDAYFASGANKLQNNDDNKTEITKYMSNLYKEILNLLNVYIKYVINQYIDSNDKDSDANKKAAKEKIKKMGFTYLKTINLSMYNYTDLQIENDRLLKSLIETSTIDSSKDITNLVNIKFSRCNDIDISKCVANNKPTGNLICELVKYRDTVKLPKNFLENFEYKRGINSTQPGMLWGTTTKSVEFGLIVKNITEKIYIEAKDLNLNLSEVFINYITTNIKKNLNETLHSFKFDVAYSKDYLIKQTNEVVSYMNKLTEIITNTDNIISYSDIITLDNIIQDFKNTMNNPDPSWSLFKDNKFSQEQVTLKIDFLNTIVKFTIKINYLDLLRNNLIWNLNSQFLIHDFFQYINNYNESKTGSNLMNEIKTIITIKTEKYKNLINSDDFEKDGFFISILDIIDKKKIAKLRIQKEDDKTFIKTGFSSQSANDKIYKSLEELEDLIFNKSRILTETKSEFLNNIMFFFKKDAQDNNWKIVLDNNKLTYYNIYINKLTRSIRNHFKNELETKYSELNVEHNNILQELGLNLSEEDLNKDIELSSKFDDQLNRLNNKKFKMFQEVQSKMNKTIELVETNDENSFFRYIINKYVISQKKLPYDFSAEYEKTKSEFNKNLHELLSIFNINKSNSNSEELTKKYELAKNKYDTIKQKYDMLKNKTLTGGSILSEASNIATQVSDATKQASNIATQVSDATKQASNIATQVTDNVKDSLTQISEEISTSDKSKSSNSEKNDGKNSNIELLKIENELKEAEVELANITAEMELVNSGSQNNLQEFIKKITNIIEDRQTSSSNINTAISKLQLMYFVQDNNYLKLINLYSQLSDSYHKLIKLEKINNIPITSKPAILLLIDKLFINNLTNNTDNEDDNYYNDNYNNDDFSMYNNKVIDDNNRGVTYNKKLNAKPIIKKIEYKLFDKLNFDKNPDIDEAEQKTVVFNMDDGAIIS